MISTKDSQANLENETKAFDSLPTEIGPAKETLYLYRKYWYRHDVLQGSIASQQKFQARATDIILVTLPKSGTTWLKSLVFAIARRSQYPISDPNHPLLTNNSHSLVPFLHQEKKFPAISNAPSPRILATNVPYPMLPDSIKDSKCRIIYLSRNPKDVLVSMWYFGKAFPGSESILLEEFFDKFCEGVTWCGPYWNHVQEFWKLNLERPEQILFLRYEDMKGDTISSQLKKVAEHLGCPFSTDEEKQGVIEEIVRLCSFEHLKNLEVNKTGAVCLPEQLSNHSFFRKGGVGDWKNVLTTSMAERLDQVMKEKFRGSGLTFP